MHHVSFGAIRDLRDLAKNFDCTVKDLERFSLASDQMTFYRPIRIPKKGRKRQGEFRTVYKADGNLDLLQKNIATAISSQTTFPEYVQGFVKGRSIATNAKLHLARKYLLHADIHNFFDSTKLPQVIGAFESLGCRPSIAQTLGKLCTLREFLPQGTSTSPVIANLVCKYLDADLDTLAVAHSCKYSRYADDITISGDSLPLEDRVAALLRKYNYELRDGKCRIQRRGRSQYVTGLTICDKSIPRISRTIKRRLRLELYYAERFGLENHLDKIGYHEPLHWQLNRIGGWISFIFSVEPIKASILNAQWEKICDNLFTKDVNEKSEI
jgi:RNA-directed DNA polymerase